MLIDGARLRRAGDQGCASPTSYTSLSIKTIGRLKHARAPSGKLHLLECVSTVGACMSQIMDSIDVVKLVPRFWRLAGEGEGRMRPGVKVLRLGLRRAPT